MSDDRKGKLEDGRPRGQGAQKGGDELNRLPPPALPPHQHIQPRRNHRRSAEATETGGGVPDDAFISPDEPLPPRGAEHVDTDRGRRHWDRGRPPPGPGGARARTPR